MADDAKHADEKKKSVPARAPKWVIDFVLQQDVGQELLRIISAPIVVKTTEKAALKAREKEFKVCFNTWMIDWKQAHPVKHREKKESKKRKKDEMDEDQKEDGEEKEQGEGDGEGEGEEDGGEGKQVQRKKQKTTDEILARVNNRVHVILKECQNLADQDEEQRIRFQDIQIRLAKFQEELVEMDC